MEYESSNRTDLAFYLEAAHRGEFAIARREWQVALSLADGSPLDVEEIDGYASYLIFDGYFADAFNTILAGLRHFPKHELLLDRLYEVGSYLRLDSFFHGRKNERPPASSQSRFSAYPVWTPLEHEARNNFKTWQETKSVIAFMALEHLFQQDKVAVAGKYLASVYRERKEFELAHQVAVQAAAIRSDFWFQTLPAWISVQSDHLDPTADLFILDQQSPDHPELILLKAITNVKHGRTREAVQALEPLFASCPADTRVARTLIHAQWSSGAKRKAIGTTFRLMKSLWSLRGFITDRKGRPKSWRERLRLNRR